MSELPSTNKPRRSEWRKRVRRVAAALLCLALAYHGLILFRVTRLRRADPATTALMERRAAESGERGVARRREFHWTPYERISPNLVRAVLAGEDIRFFQHSGIDWVAVRVAFVHNLRERRLARGASAVNQQLAKNLFLSTSRNPLRKFHEALLAVEMERILGERRILELYLNVIEWGDGIYGAEAAARHYFNASASTLSAEQAAFLAAIIPTPRANHHPSSPSDEIRGRISRILPLMRHPWLNQPLLTAPPGAGDAP